MGEYSDANDRSPAEYFLFGLGAFGLLVAAAGIVIASAGAAVVGAIILLLVVLGFYARSAE